MFRKTSNTAGPRTTPDTLLGADVRLKGDIVFAGALQIDGKVEGNVTARDSGSHLLVTEQGEITGTVEVADAVIQGRINGNLVSTASVELQATSHIDGDVHYKVLKMTPGAAVNGKVFCQNEKPASPFDTRGGKPGAPLPRRAGQGSL